ncbi:hypothetical protein SKAU_G00143630 [Synaphobranchus kaupii]|uniref:Uncharacterized protein n=1 Tax=Synaphobranchus kaupii TaxID=118154 RepID=A0A9Q1FTS0_SYNKA|nr:hypothetical protein SKAU_G00143630 [Synaphobranchus kaupii]
MSSRARSACRRFSSSCGPPARPRSPARALRFRHGRSAQNAGPPMTRGGVRHQPQMSGKILVSSRMLSGLQRSPAGPCEVSQNWTAEARL